jgi:hypothetical protein
MARVHSKQTYYSLNAVDLSGFMNTSDFERGADEHDVTVYGNDDHVFDGGLGVGKTTIGGFYNTDAAGPRATIEPLIGTVVALIHRPAGTGTGKPQDTVNVLVKTYKESAPIAGYVMWTAELTHSGAVTTANQA